MNKTMKRRLYAAPSAELICLAPNTPIATTPSWKWNNGTSNDKWGTNRWGNMFSFNDASMTAGYEWLDFDGVNPELK